jgi:heme/copper-type cytochrome/quinol oxidase subunit 2
VGRGIIVFILTVLHLSLAGSSYTYFLTFYDHVAPLYALRDPWTVWSYLNLWWAIFMLLFIFLPVALLIYKVVIKSNSRNKEYEGENGGLANDLFGFSNTTPSSLT